MLLPPYPILVVSYLHEIRVALTTLVANSGASAVPCSTFCEAESLAHKELYSGLLVDLPSIIKAKGEEKIVAYTLTNFFPTLRVRLIGPKLAPMGMSGDVKQEENLAEFLSNSCVPYASKRLREFRRHSVCLSTLVQHKGLEIRGFTLNLSWGGAFVVDLHAEKYSSGESLIITFPEFECSVPATVCRVKPWGIKRYAPGMGLCFSYMDEALETAIYSVIRTRKESDRDRLT